MAETAKKKSYHVTLTKNNKEILDRLVHLYSQDFSSASHVLDALLEVWLKGQVKDMDQNSIKLLFGSIPIPEWAQFAAPLDSEIPAHEPPVGDPTGEPISPPKIEPPPIGEAAPPPANIAGAPNGKQNF